MFLLACGLPHSTPLPTGILAGSTWPCGNLVTNRFRRSFPTMSVTETTQGAGITLTDAAAAKVAELLAQEGDERLALRVAVRPGGCSGFSYEMFFDAESDENDELTAFGGVKVVVDTTSKQLLVGATLDYKDGLQGAGFSINNPNATKTCGCGSSFS